MKTPKTPIEFDYDLWTTEDGKCMVRVKITGEVTEVDREVMKALRAEEKRIRRALRSNEGTVKDGIAHQTRTFSLSAVSENELEKSDWLVDPTSDFANVEARLFVESAIAHPKAVCRRNRASRTRSRPCRSNLPCGSKCRH